MPTPNIYMKFIIAVGLLVLSFISGFYVEHLRYANYKEQVVAEAKVQEEHTKDLVKQQQLVTEKVTNDYKNQLNRITTLYSGLHINGSSSVPSPSDALVRVNGFTTDPVFALQCANTTQQLVSLQSFVKEQLGIK